MMDQLDHSPLGGSAAHRFLNCTASFLMQRQQLESGSFENIETEFAALGTAAHMLAASALLDDKEPYEYIGDKLGGFVVGWPEGISLDAVHVYFNECVKIVETSIERSPHKFFVLVEQTITLPQLHPLLRGTVDFGFWSLKDGVKLRDYKNGEGIGVGATGNQQLLYYAFLMIMADPQLRSAPKDLPVSLGIVQPNFYGIYEDPVDWVTTLGFVIDWGFDTLLPRMTQLMVYSEVTPSDHVPGDWCQFCPVMLDCSIHQKAFVEYAESSEDFITMLTNAELDALYAQREYARRFMNLLERTVYARKVAGGSIPSAKLVAKRVSRVWRPGAENALAEEFGVSAYAPKVIKSPAQMEKISSHAKALTLEWGYKPESVALTIAPLSDPRAEAKPLTNETVFANHAQTPEQMGF